MRTRDCLAIAAAVVAVTVMVAAPDARAQAPTPPAAVPAASPPGPSPRAATPQAAAPPAAPQAAAPPAAPSAQTAPTQAAPAQTPPAKTPPAPNPFSFEALNEASRQFWERTFRSTTEAIDTTRRLATGTVVNERRPCKRAGGSTSDCESVAKEICAAKGFADGRPLDSKSVETCPTPVRLGLRKAEPGDCKIEQTLASAVCW